MQAPVITITGGYVRALRDARGYTAASFAKAVGTSASNLRRIEAGERQPAPDLRLRIATKLRIPLVALREQEPFEMALTEALRTILAA